MHFSWILNAAWCYCTDHFLPTALPGPPVDGKQLVEFFIGSVPVILFTWRYPTQFGGVKIDRSMVAHTSRVQYRGLEIEGDDNCYFVLKDVEPGIEYELTISVGNCVGESPGLLIVGWVKVVHVHDNHLCLASRPILPYIIRSLQSSLQCFHLHAYTNIH